MPVNTAQAEGEPLLVSREVLAERRDAAVHLVDVPDSAWHVLNTGVVLYDRLAAAEERVKEVEQSVQPCGHPSSLIESDGEDGERCVLCTLRDDNAAYAVAVTMLKASYDRAEQAVAGLRAALEKVPGIVEERLTWHCASCSKSGLSHMAHEHDEDCPHVVAQAALAAAAEMMREVTE